MELANSVTSTRSKNYYKTLEDRFMKVHNSIYSYENTVFYNTKTKVEITCSKHGQFMQIPSDHLRGTGCPKCGMPKRNAAQKVTLEEFIERATERHEGKYVYNNTELGDTLKDTICVTCPVHGDFNTIPSNHLSDSGGCPTCRVCRLQDKPSIWSYSKWEDSGKASAKFDSFKMYVVECWNKDERFIKVGKTYTTVAKRLGFHLPYEYTILNTVEGSAKFISELEHTTHKVCNEFKYIPAIPFGGRQECFSTAAAILACGNKIKQTTKDKSSHS